ncbi:MAG: hypothetical protein Ct9H300mP12_14310 [Acidimicrobiales bacterium]|nr:MAG: hypothetical protein Ct9H300mP12_14310 [Acidimicrobiales bacterium]
MGITDLQHGRRAAPITTHPLKPPYGTVQGFLPTVVVSGSLHVYVSQTDRGSSCSVRPWTRWAPTGKRHPRVHQRARRARSGAHAGNLQDAPTRQWSGLCDMTPDYSPVMGNTPVQGYLVDVGWGTYGFKAGPVAGETLAETIATRAPTRT